MLVSMGTGPSVIQNLPFFVMVAVTTTSIQYTVLMYLIRFRIHRRMARLSWPMHWAELKDGLETGCFWVAWLHGTMVRFVR